MRPGDLVRCNNPHSWAMAGHFGGGFRLGVIIEEAPSSRTLNKSFRVLWPDGSIGENIWDYDLKLVEDLGTKRCSVK